jgi:hypothetical protein
MNNAIKAILPADVLYFDTIALTDAIAANPTLYGCRPVC